MNDSNAELLDQFVRGRSEAAFAELVRRHVDMVHAAAQRQLAGKNHLADDVTQAVFIVFSRKAAKIRGDHLAGWLLKTTRFCVAEAKRGERRRQFHEHRAASMKSTIIENSQFSHEDVMQYLDEAIGCLSARQSTAIAMRYLQNKSTAEVAAAMGISAGAVQKIILRGMPKLRRILTGRGVTLASTGGLAEAMLEASHHAAPAGLHIAGHSAGPQLAIAKAAMRIMVWNKLQVTGAMAAITLLLGSGAGFVLTRSDPKVAAATNASAPLKADLPADSQPVPNFMPYSSPFLALEGCRIKQNIHLNISKDPSAQHLSLLASASPTGIFEKEALEVNFSVDRAIAVGTDHYNISLTSEDDGTEKYIKAPIETLGSSEAPAFRMASPVPDPGNYYVHIRACDAAENVIAQSSLPLLVQPLIRTDIEICDINDDGRLLCYGILQSRNDTDAAIEQDSLSNSGNVRVSMRDEKGRPLAITTRPEGMGVRYTYTLNEPVQPGQWEFISGNAETTVPIARKIGQDEWEFSSTYGGNDQPMRRLDLFRLPVGARFISSQTPYLQHKLVEGREQVFLDSMLKENQNILISFRYRLGGLNH